MRRLLWLALVALAALLGCGNADADTVLSEDHTYEWTGLDVEGNLTVTDGALRMLVLLYLHDVGYSPLQIASLFLFYEFFGVVTNLVGGWLGARIGLTSTLFAGLALQIVAVGALMAPPAWLTVLYVMAAQALSGIAKDLTKMSSKSYVKLVVKRGDTKKLMKWVSLLTGSKNTLKGVGFFVGAALLALVGFRAACAIMTAMLAVTLVGSTLLLPWGAGTAKGKPKFSSVFSQDSRINWLSGARFFLFGSRDVWFVLALPIFLGSSRWAGRAHRPRRGKVGRLDSGAATTVGGVGGGATIGGTARPVADHWSGDLRRGIRGQQRGSLVSCGALRRRGKGLARSRFLLHGQCRRAPSGYAAIWGGLPVGRPRPHGTGGLFGDVHRPGDSQPRALYPAPAQRSGRAEGSVTGDSSQP